MSSKAAMVPRPDAAGDVSFGNAGAFAIPPDAVLDLVCVIEDGRIVFVNGAGLAILGAATTDEVIGFRFEEFLGPAYRTLIEDGFGQLLAEREPLPAKMIAVDGSVVDIELTFHVADGGTGDRVLAIGRDLTGRKKAAIEILDRERRLSAILENVADAIITIDETGHIGSFNRAAQEIFGYTPGETIGENIKMLMPGPIAAGHDEALRAYRETGIGKIVRAGVVELEGRRNDGSTFPLELTVSEMFSGGGQVFIGTMRDISERKDLEERLRASEKLSALGQLAGGVAHDFNNLLMVIGGYTKRALDAAGTVERITSALGEVMIATDKASALTKQLLAFGRRQVLENRVLRASAVVRELEGLLPPLLGETIALTIDIEDEDACIETDPNELCQALLNLAANARDAMPSGGRLSITVSAGHDGDAADAADQPHAGRIVFSVRDDGLGMDAATVARVFEPFFTTKEQGKGTGLGLAMVYGFVQQSGGTVDVRSAPGDGTTVTIALPRADAAPPMEIDETERAALSGRGETILLAEDDDALRRLAQATLEELGYTVLAASDGMEALEMEEDYEGPIDLLLSDVVMPSLGGFELSRAVRQTRPDIKIVLMSGYPTRGDLRSIKVPDGVPLLQKPMTPEVLARNVRDVLDDADAPPAHREPA